MKHKTSLTSLQHPLVKYLVKLRTDKTYRYLHRRVLLEGLKPIGEISHLVLQLFYIKSYASAVDALPGEKWEVTQAILDKISGTTSPEGVIAEIQMPPFGTLKNARWVLALDEINDPGNLGTLMRTALALGWETVFLLPGSCDPFNEKVLRSARGAHFKLTLVQGTVADLEQWIKEKQAQALAADLHGVQPEQIASADRRVLVLGNEARGISVPIARLCQLVTVPMSGYMESLNVAVAGGILLYLFQRRSR
jgi:RNA methyltransferase, TrmH family